MARRWEALRFGPPSEGWELRDVEVPPPGPGEVSILVAAAGVNPADAKHTARETPGTTLPVPIGYEVSGTLSAIGPDTEIGSGPASVGDEVLAFRVRGGYATALTVPARDVFAKPDALSHAEAANLLLAGATAAEMLEVVRAAPGETILLHGASGAVGAAVLQLAALREVRVVGTASEASFPRVRRYGGVPVEYGEGLEQRVRAAAGEAPIAAALDAVGTDEAVDVSLALVADRSRIVTIAAPGRAEQDGIRAIGGRMPDSARFRDGIRAELLSLAARGLLRVDVARTFPLAAATEAAAFLAQGHPGGKIALLPEPDGADGRGV